MKKQTISANVTLQKLPGSEVEITGSITAETFDSFRARALKNINESIKVDGFRAGSVPEKIIISKVGEKTVLEEAAELALSEAYPSIVIDNKIDPITRPEIRITKMAAGNPLEFVMKVAVMPEVTLADYKKIARETPSVAESEFVATEKEISDAIARIRTSYETHEGHEHDHDGKHDHSAELENLNKPEFKTHIATALADDKKREAREKRRISMADMISIGSKIEIPTILIESETRRTEAQFKDDIARMGHSLEEYLGQAKKTIEDLRKEWQPYAEKKAKLQIVLNKIAEAEKISVDETEIEKEVAHIMEHYKDADRDQAHAYAAGVLTNEKVFQFLENQK
jgi:FKBP-type peptidyl-prolyl cis-trans isomerase (trigger factor)